MRPSNLPSRHDTHPAELDVEVVALRQRVASLERQLEDQRRDRVASRRDLECSHFRAANAEHELQRLGREHRLTERHLRNITRQLDVMIASKSWHVTSPLRVASRAFRRLVRFEGEPVRCDLQMAQEIIVAEGDWTMRSVGAEPWLFVKTTGVRLDKGWIRIQFRMEAESDYMVEPRLCCGESDDHRGSRVDNLRVDAYGYVDEILPIPEGTTSLWLQPCRYEGLFTVEDVRLAALSHAQARLRLGLRRLARSRTAHTREASGSRTYQRWVADFDTLSDEDRSEIAVRIQGMRYEPLISVLMPVYNVEVRWLVVAIESVRRQLYPCWELCIADDCSTAPGVRDTIEHYRSLDKRIKVCYRPENGHIPACSNSALDLATGDFIALLDHDDELREHALYMVAEELNANPGAGIIYSDQDKIDHNGQRYDPYFKSDWNVDLFYSHNLISHLGVYRRSLVHDVGGFRPGYEGSQDYDLALRCFERLESCQIRHIPHVLYHWRSIPGSVASGAGQKAYAYGAARRALADHFQRRGLAADVVEAFSGSPLHRVKHAIPAPAPLVSLVVPTRDRVDLLRRAVDGMLAKTDYRPFEIIIVDNNSCEPETFAYFDEVTERDARVRVVGHRMPFNFSAISNAAVRNARGEVIGLVNNDIDVIGGEWLAEMVSHAVRPDIGVVGALLYYPNNTIQHAGIALGIGGVAGHMHKHLPRGTSGYAGRARLVQNVSAVTAACCLVRKSVYEEVGGLDERLGVAFNDVDFCLRVSAAGYRNVLTPYAELYHFESATRGSDRGPKEAARLAHEAELMNRRFGDLLCHDPAYSPNLTLEREDLSLAFPSRALRPWQASDRPTVKGTNVSMARRLRRNGRLWLERYHPLLAARLKRLRRVVELTEPPRCLYPAGELIGGRNLAQEFMSVTDGLCGVAIRMGTFARANCCRLVLRVYRLQDGSRTFLARLRAPRLLFERDIEAGSLADGCDLAAYFPRIDDSRGRRFLVTLGAIDATPGNAVTAWLTRRSDPFSPLCVGAARLSNTSLVCQLRYAPAAAPPPYPEGSLAGPEKSAEHGPLSPCGREPIPSAELRGHNGLVQTFVAERDWLSGLSIRLSRSGSLRDGVLVFRLFDLDSGTPHLAVERTFEARLLAAGEDLEVRFPGLEKSAGRRFALTLGSADGSSGSGAEAWLAGRRDPCERLWLSGACSQHLALVCDVRYSSPYSSQAYPDAILWSPVTRCNLNCRHCISRGTRLDGVHHLAQPVREEIRSLCRAGIIRRMASDYSGDLLFNEAKYGTLSELLDFDVDFVLDTHGTVMTSALADRLLDSRLTRLNFSIDAARPETYAWIRRGSRPLAQVLTNVRLFADAWRAKAFTRTTELTMSFTLMRRNVDETLPFLELGADIGATTVAFRHLEVYTSDMAPESLYGEQDRWNQARSLILKRAAELGLSVTVPPPFDDRPARSGHRHCPIPWESVAIIGNGDVMACCIPSTVMGNLNEQSLEEIWNGSAYRALRTRVNSETPPKACSACPPFGFANNRSSYLFSEVLPTLRPLREEFALLFSRSS